MPGTRTSSSGTKLSTLISLISLVEKQLSSTLYSSLAKLGLEL
jgi:hypothetical protein